MISGITFKPQHDIELEEKDALLVEKLQGLRTGGLQWTYVLVLLDKGPKGPSCGFMSLARSRNT